MWFVGLLCGFLLGGAFESLPLALVFGIVGAVGAAPLLRALQRRSMGAATVGPRSATSLWSDPSSVADLRQQIDALGRRVTELEKAARLADEPGAAVAGPSTVRVVATSELGPPPSSFAAARAADAGERAREQAGPSADSSALETALPATAPPLLSSSTSAPSPTPSTSPPPPPPPPRAPAVPWPQRLPAPLRKLLFGGNTLVKIGVLILFLGLAFLLSYTAERVTVPVELRYALVALAGAALVGLGWFLRRRRADYALVLQGAGIGVFYLTPLSAMKLSELLPPTLGFAFLFAVAVLSAVLAVLQNAPVLAIVAALEGFAAPVLASTGANQPVALFTYLLVLDVGIFLVAWFKAWRPLNLIGLVGTFTLAAGWAHRFYTDAQYPLVQPFLIVFFVLFAMIGLLFARRTLAEPAMLATAARVDADVTPLAAGSAAGLAAATGADTASATSQPLASRAAAALRRVGRVDSSLVFGAPMAAFGLQMLMMRGSAFGAAISALAFGAFYLGLGRFVFATQGIGLALLAEAYAIVGVIFATLAIPLGFEGQWTGAAWAIEAAGMYWLGIRQQRPYSRAFAFVLVVGAVVQLLRAVAVVDMAGAPVLQGSLIGPILLAAGVFAMWWLQRRAGHDQGAGREALAGSALPWIGVAALTLLPWQTLAPPAAATATALMSVAVYVVSLRFGLAPLRAIVHALQLLAVLAFIATLQSGPNAGSGAALDAGRYGTLEAALIVLSVLATTAWSMRLAHRAAIAAGTAPVWTLVQIAGAVGGVALLHLAMLLALDLGQVALVWPVTALIVLWVALRISHPPLAAFAGVLQGAAAVLFLLRYASGSVTDGGADAKAYAHLAFWTPLALGLTGLVAGDWLRGEARHAVAPATSLGRRRWPNLWCARPAVLWLPVAWGLLWWLAAWVGESRRVLIVHERFADITAATVGILLVTSILAHTVASRRDWRQLGLALLGTLPALVLVGTDALITPTFAGGLNTYWPSSGFGWLAWPLALAWHLRLLRSAERWAAPAWLAPWHVAGLWFFLALAARECHFQAMRLGGDDSPWPSLGWVLAPALVLWALRSPGLLARWPLALHRRPYVDIALAPVAALLFAWCWLSNLLDPGNAAPLPYLPLLNPLELAEALVLAAIALWWRARSGTAWPQLPTTTAARIAAVTGWALLTGIVLRSCHHYLGVPWSVDSLYASWPTQAALSLTWAVCGVAAMVLGHGRRSRPVWIAGAVLIGVVVLKLFFVELADQGGLFRIVSFIGVGALLLLVGYFAPVPPAGAGIKAAAA